MLFLRIPNRTGANCVSFDGDTISFDTLCNKVASFLGFEKFLLYYNGKKLEKSNAVPHNATVHVTFLLPGGKGGFGSMLRAIGAQIEKTTNREACRDLSGRRLRDINEEQRLKKWISKESEREREKAERRKARIERLKSKPKHNFVDFNFEKERSELPDRIDDALTAGLQKASKRTNNDDKACASVSSKKKCLWMAEDFSDSSDDEMDAEASTSTKNTTFQTYDEACTSSSSSTDTVLQPNSLEGPSTSRMESETCEPQNERANSIREDQNSSSCFGPTESKVPECSSTGDSSDDRSLGDSSNDQRKNVGDENSEIKQNSPVTSTKNAQKENESVEEVFPPLDLLSFDSASDLESIGLNRLKSALMERNLKCGGNIKERAQRLWKVRGLQPHEFPSNLLAKKK